MSDLNNDSSVKMETSAPEVPANEENAPPAAAAGAEAAPADAAAAAKAEAAHNDSLRPGQRPRLHISSLPLEWGNAEAKQHFSQWGPVIDVCIFREPGTGRSKYGFIEMETMDQAKTALAASDGSVVEGATISAKFAAPKAQGATYGPKGSQANPGELTRLYVGNIGCGATEAQVREAFEPFGKLTECSVWINTKATERRNGYEALSAFIQYENPSDAKAAKEALHSMKVLRGDETQMLEEKKDFVPSPPLVVDYAKPKVPFGARFGDRGGDRGYNSNRGGHDDRRYGSSGGRGYDDRSSGYGNGGGYSRGYDDRRGYDSYDDRRRGYDDRSSSSSYGSSSRGYDDRYSSSSRGYGSSSSSYYPPSSSSSSSYYRDSRGADSRDYYSRGSSSRRSRSRSPRRDRSRERR